ncbi:hypothetical protein DFH06DRAFT_1441694 [Mycena polygramma]|nr:hypothetical protein DFH06DRAFT_1441694 [Mycena polygramma]
MTASKDPQFSESRGPPRQFIEQAEARSGGSYLHVPQGALDLCYFRAICALLIRPDRCHASPLKRRVPSCLLSHVINGLARGGGPVAVSSVPVVQDTAFLWDAAGSGRGYALSVASDIARRGGINAAHTLSACGSSCSCAGAAVPVVEAGEEAAESQWASVALGSALPAHLIAVFPMWIREHNVQRDGESKIIRLMDLHRSFTAVGLMHGTIYHARSTTVYLQYIMADCGGNDVPYMLRTILQFAAIATCTIRRRGGKYGSPPIVAHRVLIPPFSPDAAVNQRFQNYLMSAAFSLHVPRRGKAVPWRGPDPRNPVFMSCRGCYGVDHYSDDCSIINSPEYRTTHDIAPDEPAHSSSSVPTSLTAAATGATANNWEQVPYRGAGRGAGRGGRARGGFFPRGNGRGRDGYRGYNRTPYSGY